MKYRLITACKYTKNKAILKYIGPRIMLGNKGPSFYVWRTQYKIMGMIWIFHKGDDDFNPSLPHGHFFSKGKKEYKLELWSGNIIDSSSKKVVQKADPHEMLRLYNDKEFQQFIIEARKAYHDRNPKVNLSPLKPNPKWKFFNSLNLPIIKRKSNDMFVCMLSIKQESVMK